MKKRNKRLQPLMQAFENNEIEEFVEKLNPQEVGNLLNLIELRECELISHYHLMRGRVMSEIKTECILNSALATIAEIELVQFQQLAKISQLLVEKKQTNQQKKFARIFLCKEENQQSLMVG